MANLNVGKELNEFSNKLNNATKDFLISYAPDLISHALSHKEFQGFTGNTQTSYIAGVYFRGTLIYAERSQDKMRQPLRKKIQAGRSAYLKEPYEGESRWVRGKKGINVDDKYGAETAYDFLKEYEDSMKNVAVGLVITTGTEYSEYLEKVRHLNVLTETGMDMKSQFLNRYKAYLQSHI